jgi:hypothetical protein
VTELPLGCQQAAAAIIGGVRAEHLRTVREARQAQAFDVESLPVAARVRWLGLDVIGSATGLQQQEAAKLVVPDGQGKRWPEECRDRERRPPAAATPRAVPFVARFLPVHPE